MSALSFFVFCFLATKKEQFLNVLLTSGSFMPRLLDSLDQPMHGSEFNTQPYTQVHTQVGV